MSQATPTFRGPDFQSYLWAFAQGETREELTLIYTLVFDEALKEEPSYRVEAIDAFNQASSVEPAEREVFEEGRVHRFRQRLSSDTVRVGVQVEWATPGGEARSHLDQVSFTLPLNATQTQQVQVRVPGFPRLVAALNRTSVPSAQREPASGDPTSEALGRKLAAIEARAGSDLEDAWRAAEIAAHRAPTPTASASPREQWARAYSEAMLCTPYQGPGALYYRNGALDSLVWSWFNASGPTEPVLPLVAACQQLCSLALISLGAEVGRLEDKDLVGGEIGTKGLQQNQEGTSQAPLFGASGGSWLADPALADTRDAQEAGLGPGGVVCASTGDHIAFVLRAAPALGQVQFFDTGGFADYGGQLYKERRARAGDLAQLNVMRGIPNRRTNYDDPGCAVKGGDQVLARFPSFGSLGTTPPRLQRDSAFQAGAELLRGARSLGCARLVLSQRSPAPGEHGLLFVSSLMLLHHGRKNLRLAHLLHALRDSPLRAEVASHWIVYVPLQECADALRLAPREADLPTALGGSPAHFHPVAILGDEPDGRVRVWAREWMAENTSASWTQQPKQPFWAGLIAAGFGRPAWSRLMRLAHDEVFDPLGLSPPAGSWLKTGLLGRRLSPR